MNITELPLFVLKQIADYLNTQELADFLFAINAIDKRSATYNYIFNQRYSINKLILFHKTLVNILQLKTSKVDLSRCYQLKLRDLKELLKNFIKISSLASLNLNFCTHLTWNRTLGSFQSLAKLNLISVNIQLADLISLVNSNSNLKEIAFTMPGDLGKTTDLGCFKKIHSVSIDITNLFESRNQTPILKKLLNSFVECRNIEIFSEKKLHLDFSLDQLENKLTKLESFICSGKIWQRYSSSTTVLNLAEELLLNRPLVLFHFNLQLNPTSINVEKIRELQQRNNFKRLELNLTRYSFDLTRTSVVNNQFEIDNFLIDLCSGAFLSGLDSFKIMRGSKCECVLNTVSPFRFDTGSSLVTLDLKQIHIHSTDSICKQLASLTRK